MKIPFFHDHKLKRDELKYKSLFEHCDGLLDHLTPNDRDQFRRYLSKEFKQFNNQIIDLDKKIIINKEKFIFSGSELRKRQHAFGISIEDL